MSYASMKIITLNIQGGFKIDQLCLEIKEKLHPFDILCLQEVCESERIKNHAQQIAKSLGGNYSSQSFLPIDFKVKRMGNAFVFNRKVLQLLYSHDFTLVLPILNPFWKLLTSCFHLSCDRICQTAFFQTNQGLKIKVSNFHLDFVGGTRARKRQIKFALKVLSDLKGSDLELILGDFNTIGVLRRSFPELNLFLKKRFREVSKNITWTASPSNPDPAWRETYRLMRFLKPLGRLLRQKMDYIFAKGEFVEPECMALTLSSSDHRAVVFEFELRKSNSRLKG